MAVYRNEHVDKTYRHYFIIDIDTGECLKKPDKTEYKTVNTEINYNITKKVQNGHLLKIRDITTNRYVKHTGQSKLDL